MRKIKVFSASVAGQFGQSTENFGDNLMADILRHFFAIEPEYVKPSSAELIGIGSIIDAYYRRHRTGRYTFLRRKPWRTLHVWGSGFMNSDAPALWPQRLKFDAVRGKLSQAKVATLDDIALGDPAILLPLMWPKRQARHRVTIIPHFATHQAFVDEFANCLPRHWSILNLRGDPETIANEISASDLVVSSSLHGLIVADAYGVPSCWMEPHGEIKGDGFKFADYSSFRGRDLVGPIDFRDFVASPDAVMQEGDHAPAVPSTETLDRLLKAFPFA